MSRSEVCFKSSASKLDKLSVFQILDGTLVFRHECRNVNRIRRVDPDFIKTSCCSCMIRMNMRKNQSDRLLGNFLYYLVKVRDSGACIDKDGLVLTFDDVHSL